MRAGRSCATCIWFQGRTKEQALRYWPFDGTCTAVLPFFTEWDVNGKRSIREKYRHWCSLWTGDLSKM